MDTEFEKTARKEDAEIKKTVEKKVVEIRVDVENDEKKVAEQPESPPDTIEHDQPASPP